MFFYLLQVATILEEGENIKSFLKINPNSCWLECKGGMNLPKIMETSKLHLALNIEIYLIMLTSPIMNVSLA